MYHRHLCEFGEYLPFDSKEALGGKVGLHRSRQRDVLLKTVEGPECFQREGKAERVFYRGLYNVVGGDGRCDQFGSQGRGGFCPV